MKTALTVCALACCLFALSSSLGGVFGAAEHPKLASAYLDVPQSTLGVGGQLTLTTYVQVNGTC